MVHDVVCSWCLIGYANLKQALRNLDMEADICFLPYELNPEMGPKGEGIDDHLARRYQWTRSKLGEYRKHLLAVAKQAGVGKVALPASKPATTKPKPAARSKPATKNITPVPSSASATTEWDHLPGIRKNIANKLYQTFTVSTDSLTKSGIHADAIKSLTTSRATEVEIACHEYSKGNKQSYQDKIRSLIFNLKKNSDLREDVILGNTSAETLVKMSKQQLATAEKSRKRNETVEHLRGSRRLDWERANEDKINEMCGIQGDLLEASLFTCGRCKSIKTTSTQKQTRSADEPMTVFVLCLNCGNRWKC